MSLESRADRVVRDAVDAFMEGRLVPDFAGETVFETKNSRYRLRDGVIFVAPDAELIGAELVGWLCESPRRCLVESAWQPGSRAVLVDRKRGRNIIVTSTTRLLHLEEHGAAPYPAPSHADFRSWHPPALEGKAPFSPLTAPIIPSTPAPPSVRMTPPSTEPEPSAPHEPTAIDTSPVGSAPYAPAKRGVHLPPRPIARERAVLRPLPVPVPPPRRSSPEPVAPPAKVVVPAPPVIAPDPPPIAEPPPWEITSAEMEIVEVDDTADIDRADVDPMIPFDLGGDLDPVNSEPFPLVRPAAPPADPKSR